MATTSISIIPQNGNTAVLGINCGTSIPKIGGNINLSAFPNLTDFSCVGHDIVKIEGFSNNSNLKNINFGNNKISGTLPSLSANTQLVDFRCDTNLLTGFIPPLNNNTQLADFRCDSNILRGSIPSLSANNLLTNFFCHNNQLTGFIPVLNNNTQLTNFFCHNNQLTGPIPSLSANTQLVIFWCYNNQLTGPIPSLSANSQLVTFWCYNNQLNNFSDGPVSINLGDFQAQNNQLPSSAVNAILASFVAGNKTTGIRVLNLGGAGNAAPTGQGITDKATLISRGWTVTTN